MTHIVNFAVCKQVSFEGMGSLLTQTEDAVKCFLQRPKLLRAREIEVMMVIILRMKPSAGFYRELDWLDVSACRMLTASYQSE